MIGWKYKLANGKYYQLHTQRFRNIPFPSLWHICNSGSTLMSIQLWSPEGWKWRTEYHPFHHQPGIFSFNCLKTEVQVDKVTKSFARVRLWHTAALCLVRLGTESQWVTPQIAWTVYSFWGTMWTREFCYPKPHPTHGTVCWCSLQWDPVQADSSTNVIIWRQELPELTYLTLYLTHTAWIHRSENEQSSWILLRLSLNTCEVVLFLKRILSVKTVFCFPF